MPNTPRSRRNQQIYTLCSVLYLISMVCLFLGRTFKKFGNVLGVIQFGLYLVIVVIMIARIKDKQDQKQLLWMIAKYVLIGGCIAAVFILARQF